MRLEKARFVLGQIAHGMIRPQKEINEAVDTIFSELDKRIWIPVTKRLPIEFLDRRILVSTVSPTGRRSVDIGLWEGGKWTTYFPIGDDKVTAWMPLPEPYKGGDA